MNNQFMLLVINPGSTSTKVAVFRGEKALFQETLRHSNEELKSFPRIIDQYPFRKAKILALLMEKGYQPKNFDAVIGRGGILKPLSGGTYIVDMVMLRDLRSEARGSHASNLGGIIAYELARTEGIPAYVVDPVTVDEMSPLARITGLPEITRSSVFHALNQKATARKAAQDMGKVYEKINLIVAHLGGGISVGAHERGRVIDVNNALAGDGPFSPERAGSLPTGGLVDLCFSGYTREEVMKKLIGQGGLVAHLGTNSAAEVEKMIKQGNEEARLIYEAMAYQVAKAIGACAAALKGCVDGIVITGGIAHSQMITEYIKERVNFIAPILIYPGEDEMSALALGGLRVLAGEEKALIYDSGKGLNCQQSQEYSLLQDITAAGKQRWP